MSDEDFLAPAQFQDEPEAQVEPTEPTPAAVDPQPEKPEQTVPLAALQSERAENRNLKSRIPALEQKIEQLMTLVQTATTPKPAPIDPVTDPERFSTAIQMQIAQVASNTQAEISERLARNAHGDSLVDEAFEAARQAGVIEQLKGRKDAWGDLVKWHKAQQVAREIGDDPDAYKARLRQELLEELRATGAAGQSATRSAPTIAGQPNLGTRQAQPWAGPTPLSEILGGKGSDF